MAWLAPAVSFQLRRAALGGLPTVPHALRLPALGRARPLQLITDASPWLPRPCSSHQCEDNPGYMVGSKGAPGACVASCNRCDLAAGPGETLARAQWPRGRAGSEVSASS